MKKKFICLVALFSLLVFACSKDEMIYNKKTISSDILKLRADFGLVETNSVAKPISFKSVEDARAFLQKNKKSNAALENKVKFKLTEENNLESNSKGINQHYTMQFSTYNVPRLKSATTEDYTTSLDAGIFSSFNCNFHTDSNGNIDPISVHIFVTGAAIGWSWDQIGRASNQGNNTFLITGKITWGIELGGVILGWVDAWTLSLQFDMENMMATWRIVRFY